MAENTLINRGALALAVVDSMDIDDLREAMADRLEQDYEGDDALFQEDWTSHLDNAEPDDE